MPVPQIDGGHTSSAPCSLVAAPRSRHCGYLSSPPRSSRDLSLACAVSRSCVTSSSVLPRWRTASVNNPITICALWSSRFPVGSSANTSAGSFANARATATLCCSPPLSWAGLWSLRSDNPTRSRSSRARLGFARPKSAGGEWCRNVRFFRGSGRRKRARCGRHSRRH